MIDEVIDLKCQQSTSKQQRCHQQQLVTPHRKLEVLPRLTVILPTTF